MDEMTSLKLVIDSRAVTAANAELAKFEKAGAAGSAELAKFEKAAAKAAGNSKLLADAHAGLSTQAMAAGHAVRSMAEGLALGMSPSMLLAQQLNHLSYAASGPAGLSGAFKEALVALRGFATPLTLVGGGLAAVAAGAYFANSAIMKTERAFGDMSDKLDMALPRLHEFAAAGEFKGIDDTEFLSGIEKFGNLSAAARNSLGDLAELFKANALAVGDMDQNLLHAADLIKNARTEGDKYRLIQQLGLPPTRQWVSLLSQGADGLRTATAEASQFGIAADRELIEKARAFDAAWDRSWANWSNSGKRSFLELKGWLSTFHIDLTGMLGLSQATPGQILRAAMAGLPGAPGVQRLGDDPRSNSIQSWIGYTPGSKTTIDPAALQKQLALEQQRIGILGQTASILEGTRAVEIGIQQARLAGVSVTNQEADTLKRLAAESALGITAIKASIDAQAIEAATVGMSTDRAAAYAAAQNALNAAKLAGRTLTDDQVAAIRREADALGAATRRTSELQFEYDTFSGTFRDFGQQIRQGATVLDAFGNAGANALGKIADKLMEMAAQNLWLAAFGGSGGFGGFFSSLFGGGSGYGAYGTPIAPPGAAPMFPHHTGYGPGDPLTGGRYIHPAYFDYAPRHHVGIGPGEHAAVIRDDEGVFTAGQMRALAPVQRGDVHIYPVAGTTFDRQQNPDGSLTLVGRMIDDKIKSYDKGLPTRVHEINQDPRRR
jgi:hypothetical protein